MGQGAPHYQKLRTAIQSGQGAPDVAQMEFQFIPSFTLGDGSLLDLTPYAPPTLKEPTPEWVWSQVNVNGGLWGVPQDTGPMGLLYREDLLSDAGIEPPENLGRLRRGGRDVPRRRTRRAILSNVAPNQARSDRRLTSGRPVCARSPSTAKKTVKIDLASEEAKKVAKFWGDLVTKDARPTNADFNDAWYQGRRERQVRLVAAAAWGPVFLPGHCREDVRKVAGRRPAQWDASNEVSGNWGGSDRRGAES